MLNYFKKMKNKVEVEIILDTLNVNYIKKENCFIVKDNKYSNNGRDYTTLEIQITEKGCLFVDPYGRKITNLKENCVSTKNLKDQMLNIYGITTQTLLNTKTI